MKNFPPVRGEPASGSSSAPLSRCRERSRPIRANTLTQFEHPAGSVQKKSRPVRANTLTQFVYPAQPVLKKLPPVPGAGLSLWLFWAAYPAQQGWLRLWPGLRVNLPGWLYASRWTAVLGFPPAGF